MFTDKIEVGVDDLIIKALERGALAPPGCCNKKSKMPATMRWMNRRRTTRQSPIDG